MLIEPMSWERLQATSSGRNFQARLTEEQRLLTLAEDTMHSQCAQHLIPLEYHHVVVCMSANLSFT